MSFLKQLMLLALTTPIFVSAYPSSIEKLTHIEARAAKNTGSYDYVIIGGGTAGLTVGDRLSANGKYTVLVIEVGILDNSTAVLTGGPFAGGDPSRQYPIVSVPQENLGGRTIDVIVGKVVGGSSAINGMVLQRGTKLDYDAWATLGGRPKLLSGWDWNSFLPYLKKSIHFSKPRPEFVEETDCRYSLKYWGQDPKTKVYGTYSELGTGEQKWITEAYEASGIRAPRDIGSGENGLNCFLTHMNPEGTERSYARTGHWDNVQRKNYQLITSHRVNKILLDSKNAATGVQVVSVDGTGKPFTVKARKEVILAAGAVHTPQVLQLSGIGPAPLLKKAKIPVKVNLPGVGSNFHDHAWLPPSVVMQYGVTPEFAEVTLPPPPGNITGPNQGIWLGLPDFTPDFEKLARKYESESPAKYLPAGTDPTIIAGYAQQQKLNARYMRQKGVSFLNTMIFGVGASPQNVHPLSRGTINIDPTNPEAEPIVDYRAFSNPIDKAVYVEMIKFFRRFWSRPEFAQYQITEVVPGPTVQTDAEIGEWLSQNVNPSVFHPVGTAAKMPRAWGGVVSEELLVWGTKKLSVVDASIMPTIVGATTCHTVYAIAEKAADLIKARQ